jgi:hypothetical protein
LIYRREAEMTENTTKNSICTFRRAQLDDLRSIYDMQNIPFRDEVFANHLPSFEIFEASTRREMEEKKLNFFIMERDQVMAGYAQYGMREDVCDIIVWGRWLKTLMYASLKVAFDTFGVRAIYSAVRADNKRVINAYEYFSGRVVTREMHAFQQKGLFGRITMIGLLIYELTLEEFREKEEMFRQQAMPVEIINNSSQQ